MIFVLACSDLVVVTVIHPLLLSFTIYWFTKRDIFIRFIFDPFFGFSIFTLLTMNLERYWAVRHPYFHQRSITKRRLVGLLLILWSFVLIVSVLSHRKVFASAIPGLTILVVVFLLILYINYQMLVTVRYIKRNDALTLRCRSEQGQSVTPATENCESGEKADIKNASTCFWAILCFFLCSFPVLVHNGIWYALEDFRDDIRMPFLLWAETFLSMNSTFNCVIFFYRTTALRFEGKKLLRRCGLFAENESPTSVWWIKQTTNPFLIAFNLQKTAIEGNDIIHWKCGQDSNWSRPDFWCINNRFPQKYLVYRLPSVPLALNYTVFQNLERQIQYATVGTIPPSDTGNVG